MTWYDSDFSPSAWWAVEHDGHPAFFLSALMPGDFGPGCRPLARHVVALDGSAVDVDAEPVCGTCGDVPDSADLDPIERRTGLRGVFLLAYRTGAVPWPKRTDPSSCWLCSTRGVPVPHVVDVPAGKVHFCSSCAAHVESTVGPIAFVGEPEPVPAEVSEPAPSLLGEPAPSLLGSIVNYLKGA